MVRKSRAKLGPESGMKVSGNVMLLLTGDVMTGRGIDQVLSHPGAPELHESHVRDARDYVEMAEAHNGPLPAPVPSDYVWGDALTEITRFGPDLCIVNLETALTTSNNAWPGKAVHYRMHPRNVDCLTAARIDCCVIANNHALDWGRHGLEETLQVLHQADVNTAGAGLDGDEAWAPALLPLASDGGQLLVFACCTSSSGVPSGWSAAPKRSGIALLPDLSPDTAQILADDVKRRRSGRDLVLISLHWGANWGLELPAAHREFARRLIDLGAADVVHGHSSHHPLPLEVYRGKLILYGCGDLINDYEGIRSLGDFPADVGCLYFATLERQSGQLRRLDIVPLQRRRFRLEAADAPARQWLEQVFSTLNCQLRPLPGDPTDPARLHGWSLHWQEPAAP